jgi:glycosyltransferase involved in cell wall biosynthesis
VSQKLILHVINSVALSGGAEQQLVGNLSRFRDPTIDHHLAYLYTSVDPSWVGSINAPVTLINQPDEEHRLVRSGRRLLRLVRELEPDLIHCSLFDAAVLSRVVGRITGTPVLESLVNISHESIRMVDSPAVKKWKLNVYRAIDTVTMRWVTAFQALTDEVARSWVATTRIDPDRITVIPRGVSPDRLAEAHLDSSARRGLRSELVGDPDTPVVLVVGREEPQKGHRYLLEAFKLLSQRHPDARLLMMGRSGVSTPTTEALIADLDLNDRVTRLGVRTDVYNVMQAADMMVFPSLYEGLGVSLIESMGSGLPVVVFDRPPMNQIVRNGVSGLVVPDRDIQALAAAMESLVVDGPGAETMGNEGARMVREQYDADDVSQRVENLYRRVLDTGI